MTENYQPSQLLYYGYITLIELFNMEQKSCLNGCSVRGDCTQVYNCDCDTDWYLSDCSGGISDQETSVALINKLLATIVSLIKQDTSITSKPWEMV